MYSNNDTLPFEDVESNLLSKEKFDLEVHSNDKAEGLFIRGRSSEKEGTNSRNSRSKSKGHKFGKFCKYYRKSRHLVAG